MKDNWKASETFSYSFAGIRKGHLKDQLEHHHPCIYSLGATSFVWKLTKCKVIDDALLPATSFFPIIHPCYSEHLLSSYSNNLQPASHEVMIEETILLCKSLKSIASFTSQLQLSLRSGETFRNLKCISTSGGCILQADCYLPVIKLFSTEGLHHTFKGRAKVVEYFNFNFQAILHGEIMMQSQGSGLHADKGHAKS